MRLTALEVNFSIWVSDKGWTTSDNLNTFFLPLAPVSLEQNKITQGNKSDLHKGAAYTLLPVSVLVPELTWFVP